MRATQHSGRYSGGSQKHNDRAFDLEKAPHIDTEKMQENIYLPCYKGMTFAEAEQKFYEDTFADMIADINHRAELSRHRERRTSASKLLSSKKTMPEEVIFQIGDIDESVSMQVLGAVFKNFYQWHQKRFGKNVHTLNIAYHVDEKTPHIHLRRVWIYEHEKGFKAIGQHKALLELGYMLPDDTQKRGRYNNLKQQYSADCREKWLQLCQEHGIDVEKTPKKSPFKQKNMEKNDYVISKQREKIEEQKKTLDNLQAATDQQQQYLFSLSKLKNEKDDIIVEILPEPKKLPVGAILSSEQWEVVKSSFDGLKRKLEAYIAKIAELSIKINTLQEDNRKLKANNTALEKENNTLKKSTLYQKNQELENENWILFSQMGDLKEEFRQQLRDQKEELTKEIKAAYSRIEIKDELHSSAVHKFKDMLKKKDKVIAMMCDEFNVTDAELDRYEQRAEQKPKKKNKEYILTR